MAKGGGRHLGRIAVIFTMLVSLVVAASVARAESEMGKDKFKVGDKAPDFALADTAGKTVKLSDYLGKKVILLNFWGLRCGACLEEMPYLELINKKYLDKGLVILGVDTDGVDAAMVNDTVKEVGLSVTYPLLVDPEFKATDVYTNFLVPLTLVIDKEIGRAHV
jgi:peroxiredoxin